MSEPRGKVVVISGPSGSGKTSVIEHLRRHPRVTVSVSVTTRPARPNETDGRDYHFVSRDTFQAMMERDEFIETNDVFSSGHLYGSVRADLDQAIRDPDRIYIMEVDVVGASNLIEMIDEGIRSLYIFIQPPAMDVLEKRLRSRGTDRDEDIRKRLDRARIEMEQAQKDHAQIVVNDDLDNAVQAVERLIGLDTNATV